jgi:hypothetical protein
MAIYNTLVNKAMAFKLNSKESLSNLNLDNNSGKSFSTYNTASKLNIMEIYISGTRPLKTDSAPVRGDGYKPGSYLEPTQRHRTACGQDLVVVVGVEDGSEKFSDSEILKTTTVGSL